MKKRRFLIAFLTALLGILCAIGLVACGESGTSVKGTYYYYENGNVDKTKWVELNSDEWKDCDGLSGTYEVSGDEIVFYVDLLGSKEIISRGTVKDGVLTVDTAGVVSVFCKDGAKPSDSPNTPIKPSTEKVTITYHANGGKFANDSETFSQTVNKNALLTAPDSPVRTNYTFAGWTKSKNGSTMWKFDEDRAADGITLWAKWTEKSAAILSVDGASINGNSVFMLVDRNTDAVSLSGKVVCSSDSVWRLYYDRLGQTEIPTKMAAGLSGYLANGNNVFYMVVTSQDGVQTNLYELTVHRSYAVSVNYYNGVQSLKSESVYTGSTFTANYTPQIEGYTFNGWKDGEAKDVREFTVWGNVSLFADKTANNYTVRFNVNGGDELQTTEQTVTYDKAYRFAVPAKTGHSFLGWYYGSTQIADATGNVSAYKIADDVELTAKWKANTYTVTARTNNENGGTVTGGGDYKYDSSVTLTATTKNGYTFTGWYDSSDTMVSATLTYRFTMGFSASYTAKWIRRPVTVESNNYSYGTVSSLPNITVAGEEYTVTATTKSGCTFIGWYNGNTKLTEQLNYTFTMPSENTTYTAKWIKVTLTSENTNKGTVNTLSGQYLPGDEVTATATTKTGYTFIGWYNGNTKLTEQLNYKFTMPSENVTYTAKWIKVTLTSENTSKGTVNTLSGQYLSGDEVTATATANLGYVFIGWYNGETKIFDALSYTFEMPSENATYTAKWTVDSTMSYFTFTSTSTRCTVTGLKDKSVTSIAIPDYVTSIAANAFEGCSGLTSVTIGKSVTSIGDYAFSGCSDLTGIAIGNSVTSIWGYAFSGCSGLTSITIPDSVTRIGSAAFSGCSDLTSITIPFVGASKNGTNNTHFGYIFGASGSNYNSRYVPSSLKSVIVTGGTSIDSSAFEGCSGLTSITIPDSVTSIGNHAFYACSGLTSITIPDDVTNIGGYAFSGCSKLTSIAIPDSVTSIWGYAFSGCRGLTSITIPDSVTSIGNHAFYACSGLTSIAIPDSVTSIEGYAFEGCSGLTSITIPDSVTSIGDSAFEGCSGLTSITIPDSVTSIGNHAFYACSGLTSITIPDSVTSIEGYAFSDCRGLTIYCETTQKPSGWDSNWNSPCPVVWNCKSNDKDENGYAYSLIDGIRYSLRNGIATVVWQSNAISGEISIPQTITYKNQSYSVTSIGSSAFRDCSGLTSVTIGNSVTSIDGYAFSGCSGLTSITIPDGVTSIRGYAFYGCSRLTSITIPDSVTSIGYYAFDSCSRLTSITIPDSVTSIGTYAFSHCSSLTSVTFANTSGWNISRDSDIIDSISSSALSTPSTAAKYLSGTYCGYVWERG